MKAIEVKNVSYTYDNIKNAVNNVSFAVEKGSYTVIVGHNGSGKSTLAKLIAGLLELKDGEITIDGLILNQDNLYKIREKLGIVFQNPDNQFIGSTVRDDIAFGLENHCVETNKMNAIIEEFAKKVGIEDFLEKEPGNLSGGQKQRVAIAGILAMNPDIIIFDEATSMLDPKGKAEIKKLINDLHKDKSMTIISITHDIEEVLHADDCIVLNKGSIYMHDTPENVFNRPEELRKIDLDIPFNLKVKEAFKKNKINLKANDIDGMVEEIWQYLSRK